MELANPLALGLLALVALGAALLWAPRRRAYILPSTTAFGAIPASIRLRAAMLLPVVRILAAIALVVAIARPRAGEANAVIPSEGIDIVLTLDLSSSMNQPLGEGRSRLEATRDVVREFIAGRPDDRLGLVVFQEDALPLAPPSLDHDALGALVAGLDSSLLPDGTGIGAGLASALNMLRDSTAASRTIILLTDGEQNAPSIAPEEAASLAAALRVRVYTIGVVRDTPGNGGVDSALLEAIAGQTGGRFFTASSPEALAAVYDEIGSLETSSLTRDRYTEYTEYGPWFAGAAAGLLLLEAGLRATWLRRTPA